MGKGTVGMREWIALFAVAILAAADCYAAAPGADSLAFPSEVLVITAAELSEYNIHSIYDILRLVPGASQWIEGPTGSSSGISIDGRNSRSVAILLNGEPYVDPYTLEQLARFIPLSRLKQVEIHYHASPFLTGSISSRAAVNFVLEEGGRGAPSAELDFTYGKSNRRARRIWFASPRTRIDAVIAYDEYLQDAFESYLPDPSFLLGRYDGRSVLMELRLIADAEQVATMRLHRFEDICVGTAYARTEGVRYDGYDAGLQYRRGRVTVSLRQRTLSMSRRWVRRSAFVLGGAVRWAPEIAGIDGQLFVSAERTSFENVIAGSAFDPSMHRVETGFRAGWRTGSRLAWRLSFFAGEQNEVGRYVAGEAGLFLAGSDAIAPHIVFSRSEGVPSPQELFQPESLLAVDGTSYLPVANPDLEPELIEEISLGTLIYRSLAIDLFSRNERRRIVASESLFRQVDGKSVTGARGRFAGGCSLFGFDCALNASLELFDKRSELTPAVPEYRAVGGLLARHAVFKKTETLSLRWDTEFVGERSWEGTKLNGYMLHDVSCSLTLLKARVVFQYKNIFDEEYETVPGFLMPGRHYIIGIWWEFVD